MNHNMLVKSCLMKPMVINCTISYNDGVLLPFMAHPYIHLQKFMLLAALIMKVICTSVKLKHLQNELLNCPEVCIICTHCSGEDKAWDTRINKYLVESMSVSLPLTVNVSVKLEWDSIFVAWLTSLCSRQWSRVTVIDT